MSPDDERTIERYVRRPDALAAEERRAVERLIERDPGAAAYAAFLEGFYDRLDEEMNRAPDSRVEAFVDALFGDSQQATVALQPFRPSRETRPTVLAAETSASTEERRFSVLTTLAAEAEQVLVRVVKDGDTGRGRLYVLADPPEHRAHVVVSFPELGLDLVVDEEGRLEFQLPPEIDDERWADVQAVVRRPVITGEATSSATTTLSLPKGGTLRCRREADTLTASLDDPGPDPPSLLTATRPGESPHLLRLQPDAPARCTVESTAPLVLRVYE